MNKKFFFYYINVLPTQGGKWFYALNQLEFLIKNVNKNFKIRVLVTNKATQKALKKNNINSTLISITLMDKIFLRITNFIPFLKKFIKYNSFFEKKLIKMDCHLLYVPHLFFLTNLLKKIPTIVTILDLCHLDFPELKEFLNNNDIKQREKFLNLHAKNNFFIVADCEDTKKKLIKKYRVVQKNILIKYFDISKNITINKQIGISLLKNKKFIFYPSNFWSHKNHKLIIDAHKYIKDKELIFVFSGNDRGYLSEIKKYISDKKLEDFFFIFKSLDLKKMNYLYSNCLAIIYPSLFGPTNIPLFEAWYLKKLIFYPKQFKNFSHNGAILFDNQNSLSFANSINNLKDYKNNKKVINRGTELYNQYRKKDELFMKSLNERLKYILKS